jgi:hypothetical protein
MLDIIHRPVFYLEHNVSETGFCLRLQVEPTKLGPKDEASFCLRSGQETEIISIYWSQMIRFRLKTEKESSLRKVVF